MSLATTKLSLILFGLSQMLKFQRRRHEAFRKRLKERNFIAQIMARDEEVGRWFEFKDGVIRSRAGLHPKPDCKLMFKNAAIGVELLDAADQLAAPDQRAEGFRAHRRRAGGPHQLVRADRDDEPVGRAEDGHAHAGRLACAIAT